MERVQSLNNIYPKDLFLEYSLCVNDFKYKNHQKSMKGKVHSFDCIIHRYFGTYIRYELSFENLNLEQLRRQSTSYACSNGWRKMNASEYKINIESTCQYHNPKYDCGLRESAKKYFRVLLQKK